MKRSAILTMTLVATAAWAGEDVAGAKDHPLFTRYPDSFIAEYTKAYSLLFSPSRDNRAILGHLTEAKRWFDEIPGNNQQVWDFFYRSGLVEIRSRR